MTSEVYAADVARLVEPRDETLPGGDVARRFTTTTAYLDCNCETDYMHPRVDMPRDLDPETYVICNRCGTIYDDAPDSRGDEVRDAGLPIDPETLQFH